MMEPQRQSALHRWHVEAGGRVETFAGWRLPLDYGTQPGEELARVYGTVGISDASALTKLDLRGHAGELPLTRPARLWMLTANHALVTSPEPIAFAPSASVTDVTSVYSGILLAGLNVRPVLQKLTTLNVGERALANGAARQARMAHVNAIILRADSAGVPGFLILNSRDLAEHVWEALLEAGGEFGITPFGVVAQEQWLGNA